MSRVREHTLATYPFIRTVRCVTAALLILSCAHCGQDSGAPPNTPSAAVIGTLSTKLQERLAARVQLSTYAGGSTAPILLQGNAIASLSSGDLAGIKRTYDAGWSVVILDATEDSVRTIEDLVDPSSTRLRVEPRPNTPLLAHVVRRERGAHHPTFLVDPQGVTDYDTALDSAVSLLQDVLHAPSAQRAQSAATGTVADATFDIASNPAGQTTIAIPQPNEGAFNTMLAAYAVHECDTGLDHYVVTSLADWTPGSTYLSAMGDNIDSPPFGEGPQSVRAWTNEYIEACGAEKEEDIPAPYQNLPTDLKGGKDNTACEFIDYPLSYAVQMVPPPTGTVLQIDASPEATQGLSTDYSSGFSFSIDGNIGWYGGSAIAGDLGATWDSETSTNVPAMLIEAGNVGNQGVQWTFDYCTKQSDSGCDEQSIQPANPTHTCQNALGAPQNGQTLDGKFSNGGQMVHWTAACNTRVGSTFDITVTFTANLANTQILVWGSDDADLGTTGGTCNTINEPFSGWCACDVNTIQNPISGSFTFKIPFPPNADASTCPLPCSESVPPSETNHGCTCICPETTGCAAS